MQRPIIFLHIPKTAGQSIHAFMQSSFETSHICPARENWQMAGMSISQIRQYRLFSGHLDWAHLDCVHPDPFIFTVLRNPLERILSFYFFLRRKAQKIPSEEIKQPHRRGMHAALFLSPDEYFTKGPPDLRTFIDDHFDNFYTYYFCGRTFDARRKLVGLLQPGRDRTISEYVDNAKKNLGLLSGVYRVSDMDRLETDLREVLPKAPSGIGRLREIKKNVGSGTPESRLEALRAIGPAEKALERINQMCAHDNRLWEDESLFQAR